MGSMSGEQEVGIAWLEDRPTNEGGAERSHEVREINMLKAAFTVYIFPLIAVFFGEVAASEFASWAGIATGIWPHITGGAGAFLVAIWYIKHYDTSVRMDEKMQPVIARILSS